MAAASRQFDLAPAEIASWVDNGKRDMENALRAKPELAEPIITWLPSHCCDDRQGGSVAWGHKAV